MIEKRFIFDPSISHFKDTQTDRIYCEYNLDKVVDLLNEQHEEIERLKKENELKGDFREFIAEAIIKIKDENEQLKEDNNALIKILENQSIIIQEQHSKILEYDLKEPITLTKEDLEIMGKAISYYLR